MQAGLNLCKRSHLPASQVRSTQYGGQCSQLMTCPSYLHASCGFGVENLKEVQRTDEHFGPIILALEQGEQVPTYSLHEDYLFHGVCLCISHGSLHDLVRKRHNSGHFGVDMPTNTTV